MMWSTLDRRRSMASLPPAYPQTGQRGTTQMTLRHLSSVASLLCWCWGSSCTLPWATQSDTMHFIAYVTHADGSSFVAM